MYTYICIYIYIYIYTYIHTHTVWSAVFGGKWRDPDPKDSSLLSNKQLYNLDNDYIIVNYFYITHKHIMAIQGRRHLHVRGGSILHLQHCLLIRESLLGVLCPIPWDPLSSC